MVNNNGHGQEVSSEDQPARGDPALELPPGITFRPVPATFAVMLGDDTDVIWLYIRQHGMIASMALTESGARALVAALQQMLTRQALLKK